MPRWKQKPVCEGNFGWCVCLALPHGSQLFKSRHTLCQHPSLFPSLSFHLTCFFRPYPLLFPSRHLNTSVTTPTGKTSLYAIPYRNTSFFFMCFRALFWSISLFLFFFMIQELAVANDPIRCDSRVPNQNGEFGSADFGCRASVWDVRREKKDWFDRSSG